jgi:hypothetical protein
MIRHLPTSRQAADQNVGLFPQFESEGEFIN